MYEFLLIIFFSVLGLVLASFGNMLVYRLKTRESLLTRSHCEFCKHELGPLDLLPVFSFLLLKGKCRYCRKTISKRELSGEIFLGVIAALWGYLYATGTLDLSEAVIYMGFSLGIFVIAISDALYLEIPDEMQIFLILCGILNILTHGNLLGSIFNVAFAAGLLLLTFFLTGDKKMGFGDVKLAFGLGFFLNYFYFTLAIFISSVAGILFALIVSGGNKKKLLKYLVPYGSFLSIVVLVMILALYFANCDPLVFNGVFC